MGLTQFKNLFSSRFPEVPHETNKNDEQYMQMIQVNMFNNKYSKTYLITIIALPIRIVFSKTN